MNRKKLLEWAGIVTALLTIGEFVLPNLPSWKARGQRLNRIEAKLDSLIITSKHHRDLHLVESPPRGHGLSGPISNPQDLR